MQLSKQRVATKQMLSCNSTFALLTREYCTHDKNRDCHTKQIAHVQQSHNLIYCLKSLRYIIHPLTKEQNIIGIRLLTIGH